MENVKAKSALSFNLNLSCCSAALPNNLFVDVELDVEAEAIEA